MPDNNFELEVTDNTGAIIEAFEENLAAALEEIGLRAEGYAKKEAPVGTSESTGVRDYVSSELRQSIAHKVIETSVYIGTNKAYAAYVELGTGIYASDGHGRRTPWVWYDKNGKAHKTVGMQPRHFLKSAASEHTEEYRNVLRKYLGNV